MRIGFDNDGCLSDFQRSWCWSVGIDYEANLDKFCCWDFYQHFGYDLTSFIDSCNVGANAGILFTGEPHPGAVDAVNSVKSQGHTTVMITDRSFGATPAVSERITLNWVRQYGFQFDQIVFSADKTIVHTDTFVEDKLQNYDALDAAGTEVYLINRPWNQEVDNRRRIDDISEFAGIVNSKTSYILV